MYKTKINDNNNSNENNPLCGLTYPVLASVLKQISPRIVSLSPSEGLFGTSHI